jgi:hypothetical protein
VGLAAAGALVAGCTSAAAQPRPVPVVDPVNLDPLKLTIDMIRFDTSHNGEGGVTVPHAEMLKSIWDAAGAQTEIIPTPKPDKCSFHCSHPERCGKRPATAAAVPLRRGVGGGRPLDRRSLPWRGR